jgi:hypothetical protein
MEYYAMEYYAMEYYAMEYYAIVNVDAITAVVMR